MKLSMWLLARRFSSYDIKHDIIDGMPHITGVRFFSEELSELSPDYVYVGKGSDAFSDPGYQNTVLLVNGYDLMYIKDQSAEDVLNEVLSAFDYYNSWESSLWVASADADPIQTMIDLSSEVMQGPLGIADTEGHILAYTHDDSLPQNDKSWRHVFETGMVPTDYTSSQIRDAKGNLLDDWATYPQIIQMENHTCIGAQIAAGEEIVAAFYMQQRGKELTSADEQLAEVFCSVLSSVASLRGAATQIQSSTAILGSLLDGEVPEDTVLARLDAQSARSSPFQLLIVRSATSSINIVRKNTLLETINALDLRALSLIFEDDIVCIISASSAKLFLQALAQQVNLSHYAVGVSLPFADWLQVFTRYHQAQFAIELSPQSSGVSFSLDHAFERQLAELRTLNSELDLIHPDLETLRNYDKKNATEFADSLYQYLSNDRNMVKTAELLCIHRNSLKYRMRRIRELIEADLDDPTERLYLLLSYRLDDQSDQR